MILLKELYEFREDGDKFTDLREDLFEDSSHTRIKRFWNSREDDDDKEFQKDLVEDEVYVKEIIIVTEHGFNASMCSALNRHGYFLWTTDHLGDVRCGFVVYEFHHERFHKK